MIEEHRPAEPHPAHLIERDTYRRLLAATELQQADGLLGAVETGFARETVGSLEEFGARDFVGGLALGPREDPPKQLSHRAPPPSVCPSP